MTERLRYWEVSPEAYRAMGQLNAYLSKSKLEKSVRYLTQLRVSQINGCSYCIERHTAEALREAERPERLDRLAEWQSSSCYTPRERAALAWSEVLTNIAQSRAPDAVYAQVRQFFDDGEIVDLTLTVSVMNAWNRMAIGFRRGAEGQQQKVSGRVDWRSSSNSGHY